MVDVNGFQGTCRLRRQREGVDGGKIRIDEAIDHNQEVRRNNYNTA